MGRPGGMGIRLVGMEITGILRWSNGIGRVWKHWNGGGKIVD